MAIYRGTGGFSNVTGTAEIEYVTEKSVEIQNAVAEVEQLAAEITSNTSAAQAAADTAVAASNGVQGFAAIASDKALEAQTSATNAATSANTATTQALAASTSATNAATSEANASTSATNAANSATTATTQAGIATTKASEASTSASNAASSASSASTSASTATTASTTATTKANEASASAAAAAQSAIDAATFDPTSYYTKTALDGGQLDTRYYTESEVNTALSAKQATLVSGTNIKTVGGTSILGSGDISTTDATKLPLSGGTMTGAITSLRETKVAMAANDINLSLGNFFTKTVSTATTFTLSNVPATGQAVSFILELTNGGSGTVTWPTVNAVSVVKWAGGTAPTLTTSGVDILGFYSHDGGTTWRGMMLSKDSK
jgi:hypothetical protein